MSYDYTQIMLLLHRNIRPATVHSSRIACVSDMPVTVCKGQRVCTAYGFKRMECRPDNNKAKTNNDLVSGRPTGPLFPKF